MRRLFWPFLGTVLLEGFFLGIIWWAVAAVALAVVVFWFCEAVRVNRVQDALIAQFNEENSRWPVDKAAARHSSRPATQAG